MERVDAIVIGSGQGGVPLAEGLAKEGRQVVLFERDRFGGTCINWGCTPTKAFLAAAHAVGRARQASALGIRCRIEVDFPGVMDRVRRIRDRFSAGARERLEKAGVTLVRAEAAFTERGEVEGGGRAFAAPLTVIDTGTSPAMPPIEGLADIPYLTDRNFWSLTECPPRTLVIGGGYIGLELGQGLARLGSRVHIIERGDRILSGEDAAVSAVLDEALQRDGVSIHCGADVTRAARRGDVCELHLDDGQRLEGEAVLVAVGRRPSTAALNAERAGIALEERGYIKVNERLETSRPGVYAIGEVAGQPAFTHVSWEDHRRLRAILGGESRTRDDRVLGYAVFTEPQVGRAGLSGAQARARGLAVREARLPIETMSRAVEWGHELGFFELVVDTQSDRLVGATIVGYEGAELIQGLLDLIESGATAGFLERMQHIHPTYAEYLPVLAARAGLRG